MHLIKRIIALVSFIVFIVIGIFIFYERENLEKEALVSSGIENLDEYFLNAKNRDRTSLGIYNIDNENKILSAANEEVKDKIIKLISSYNNGDKKYLEEDFKSSIYELLEKSKIKFIGDSNTEHFKFYDVLDEKYFFAMTGKNIDEERELLDEKALDGVKNAVFFNGYNLDKYNSSDEYIESYKKIISKIKSIDSDIRVYICSLLPATKKAIEEDIIAPLPHKIYNGIEYDLALENYDFENAEYIDTKWFMEDDKHKSDGVHMEKYFYEIIVPYVCLYVNLYNEEIGLDKSSAMDVFYLEDREVRKNNKDKIAEMLNADEYVSEVIDDEVILKGVDANATDKYIFDVNDELNFFVSICGINAVYLLNDVVFVGDSHADRLTRTLSGFVTLLARPSRTLRKIEDAYMKAFNSGKKYVVIYMSNNEVKFQTDLMEYRNEYEYIHKLVEKSDKVEDVFICTFFQNNVTKYVKNKEFPNTEEDYNNVIKEVCDEYDDMHYIDFSEIHDDKYVLPDGHMGYVYNKKALTKVIRYIYKFDQLKKQKLKNDEAQPKLSDNMADDKKELIELSTVSIASLQNEVTKRGVKKDFKTLNFGSIEGKDIEWLILDEDDESMTLFSKYILDAKPFNEEGGSTTWEKSSIRKYLNDEFYERIFSDSEKEKILVSDLENKDNEDSKTSGGNSTSDRVYLISIDEIKKYFEEENGFAYESLASKVIDGININISKNENADAWYKGNSAFWLRSPGLYDDDAAYINFNGTMSINGVNVSYKDVGIRPVIKIKK